MWEKDVFCTSHMEYYSIENLMISWEEWELQTSLALASDFGNSLNFKKSLWSAGSYDGKSGLFIKVNL